MQSKHMTLHLACILDAFDVPFSRLVASLADWKEDAFENLSVEPLGTKQTECVMTS